MKYFVRDILHKYVGIDVLCLEEVKFFCFSLSSACRSISPTSKMFCIDHEAGCGKAVTLFSSW